MKAGHVYSAPAKLNLFLHITGRRADGYHQLQTLFRLVDLQDALTFEVRSDYGVRRVTAVEGVPPDQDLIVRAAQLLQQQTGCRKGVDIAIDKRIPMGGGLGGGSSDAATVLLALNQLWELGLDRQQLMSMGLQLGADVPVFVYGHNAFAEGVGEQLQAVTLPPCWYVIVFPSVHVSTAEIFSHPDLTRDTKSITMRALLSDDTFDLHNDMQSVVCQLYPQVSDAVECLGQFGQARMTGSGSCVFAEFEQKQQADDALAQLPDSLKGIVVRGLDQHPFQVENNACNG